jgi:hypothetical protein
VVLLNPPEAPTRKADLGGDYRTIDGRRLSRVTLVAASAAVLRADCATSGNGNSEDRRSNVE